MVAQAGPDPGSKFPTAPRPHWGLLAATNYAESRTELLHFFSLLLTRLDSTKTRQFDNVDDNSVYSK